MREKKEGSILTVGPSPKRSGFGRAAGVNAAPFCFGRDIPLFCLFKEDGVGQWV